MIRGRLCANKMRKAFFAWKYTSFAWSVETGVALLDNLKKKLVKQD